MIQLTESLWIGDSADVEHGDLNGVGAVLNVANDLPCMLSWGSGIEYAQVGLIDGPGNEVIGYCAAVMALVALSRRHESVLVYDHDGGRALAVGMMYLNLIGGKFRPEPVAWSHWLTWSDRLTVVRGSVEAPLPKPHAAHVEAFAKIPYGLLEAFL